MEKEKDKREFVTVKSDEHTYKIPIMNTHYGLGFAARYQDLIDEKHDKESLGVVLREKCKDPDVLFELMSMLLSGAEVDSETCDDLGACGLFRRRPVELFIALLIAIQVNYRDIFPFALEPLDTEENI